MVSPKTVRDIGEFQVIERIQKQIGSNSKEVWVGLGDDAAVFYPRQQPLVVTTDTMIENTHFQMDWCSAEDLAHKSLASNISDLAAKCASPAYCLVTLGLPPHIPVAWVDDFYRTLTRLRNHWEIEVIGGDTVRSSEIVISITAIGYQKTAQPVCLHTAQIGDQICVTGTLGDATAGLELCLENAHRRNITDTEQWLLKRFHRPDPRWKEALRITQEVLPASMTDISDGLARDLPKLCRASNVGAILYPQSFPCSMALQEYAKNRCQDYAWKGGEDYELLFTLSPNDLNILMKQWKDCSCPITVIGEIVSPERGVIVNGWKGNFLSGYDHFKE